MRHSASPRGQSLGLVPPVTETRLLVILYLMQHAGMRQAEGLTRVAEPRSQGDKSEPTWKDPGRCRHRSISLRRATWLGLRLPRQMRALDPELTIYRSDEWNDPWQGSTGYGRVAGATVVERFRVKRPMTTKQDKKGANICAVAQCRLPKDATRPRLTTGLRGRGRALPEGLLCLQLGLLFLALLHLTRWLRRMLQGYGRAHAALCATACSSFFWRSKASLAEFTPCLIPKAV